MTKRQKGRVVLLDPYRSLLAAIITDAVKTVRCTSAYVTERDRYEAERFLRGEKCKRWCDDWLNGVDYGRMIREVFGDEE
jgi:hypothetical protein